MEFEKLKIRCPKCSWEPLIDDLWESDCGYLWNTFTTFGKCPSCGKVYKETQCLECLKWSPHADWYVDLVNMEFDIFNHERVKVSK